MRKLGISIYPDKSTMDEMKEYIQKAKNVGFSRIFSNLLQVTKSKEEVIKEFKEINEFAQSLGFEIIVDISPAEFKALGITTNDLSFFKEISADGVRLDTGFGGKTEADMTYNPEDLLIEVNMSMDTHAIDNIIDFYPLKGNLIACHNFYPHPFTGLSDEYFFKTTENFTKYGLRTAAFVGSQAKKSFGPWPVSDGIVTLEKHRELPIDVQIKDFVAMGLIDDIIIANCYPTEQELKAISKVDLKIINFKINLNDNISSTMEKIVLQESHFYRGDSSEYLIRSYESRIKYKNKDFPQIHTPKNIKKGDVLICSDTSGHYAGELQIALKNMTNTMEANVVGHIREKEIFILDRLKPWQKFKFTLD